MIKMLNYNKVIYAAYNTKFVHDIPRQNSARDSVTTSCYSRKQVRNIMKSTSSLTRPKLLILIGQVEG